MGARECQCQVAEPPGNCASGAWRVTDSSTPFATAVLPALTLS